MWLAPAPSRAATEVIFSDDFESGFGNFVQVAGDDFDWSRDSGGTPSTGTGPDIDHTLGTASGFYLYTEASAPNNPNLTTLIETACLDLSANSSLTWSFWYHMFGTNMGSLFAEVAPGCGTTWDTISTQTGSNQTATTGT